MTIIDLVYRYPEGFFVQSINFDFFNYAGIHRPVRLYITPKAYVDDVTVVTDFFDNTGKTDGQAQSSTSIIIYFYHTISCNLIHDVAETQIHIFLSPLLYKQLYRFKL